MKRTAEKLLSSYHELICSLLPGCLGVGILDGELTECGSRGAFDAAGFAAWLRSRPESLSGAADLSPARRRAADEFEVALALVDSTQKLIAVVGVGLSQSLAKSLGANPGKALRQRLRPVLDCLHRELASAARAKSKVATLSERTRDLEWLFQISGELAGAASNQSALEHLLRTAAERMQAACVWMIVPAQSLLIRQARVGAEEVERHERSRAAVQPHLLAWSEKHHRPLISNRAGTGNTTVSPCKLLAVPLRPAKGAASGILLFINPPNAPDFVKRQGFLAADVARHATQLLQAQYDLATGLLTRAALQQSYAQLPPAAKTLPQTVLHLDVDRLHVINNVCGFQAGDNVIVRVANVLGPPLVPNDALIARISGDQFALVLPDMQISDAVALAERIRQQVSANAAEWLKERPQELTLSCGIAAITDSRLGLAPALVAAEAACRTAKEHGRNRVEVYSCDDASVIQRVGDVHKFASLGQALKTDCFELFAQSVVPLGSTELAGGYEVLLRLRKDDGTYEGPNQFLPAAERYQMMPAIDRWVFDHTMQSIEEYSGVLRRRGLGISWNMSGKSLDDDQFVDHMLTRIRNSRFPPGLLTVEITEQSALRNLASAASLMKRLREIGCGVALDDFGSGANSLTYLRELPLTRVKIDGSFVRDVLTNSRSESTLRSIVELLRPFNVEIVAEYIETQAMSRKVGSLGIDYGQGYAFGRPEPLRAVLIGLQQDESRRLHRLALEI